MAKNKIDALLALRSEGRFLVGRERIKLLEAVAEHSSITKAAKAAGFSYKTAWEAVNAINNLLPSPAFVTKAGGRTGGGAEVTKEGRRLITTFHRLEERLSRISTFIAEEGLEGQEEALLWTLGLRISARNVFRTEVVKVEKWSVDVEVTLRVSETHTILAIVTNDAAIDLELVPGRRVLALVKAPFVRLALPDDVPADRRNWFIGAVTHRHDAERNSEVRLDIGGGKTLTAVVPRQSIDDLAVGEGKTVAATFDANHVILAVD
ncbi:MAG: LysR family transcriptional regulator [Xanthobacteraceae bacterium]|nr:MAG: LysR family transcriptional regulator [Xanthobacteraceae bacterium]